MTRIRRFLVPLAAVLSVSLTGAVAWARSASSAATTTFSYTVAGTDAHGLDARAHLQFVNGGGVQLVQDGAAAAMTNVEANLDLPVGAKVTAIVVSYTSCPSANVNPTFVFGSYSPSTRATVQTSIFNPPRSCSPASFTKTGNPITTTVAGRRYAIDFDGNVLEQYPGTGRAVFFGATVKYTCASPCVP